jgi:hypothetical protein
MSTLSLNVTLNFSAFLTKEETIVSTNLFEFSHPSFVTADKQQQNDIAFLSLMYPRRLGMSKVHLKPDASKILSDVPKENSFRFCTADEGCTQISAISLEDFANKLEEIDTAYILFHYPRGDFQAWIKDCIGDRDLADKMCFIQRGISGENLRQELLKMVKTRISDLKALKKDVFPSSQCNKDGLCLS